MVACAGKPPRGSDAGSPGVMTGGTGGGTGGAVGTGGTAGMGTGGTGGRGGTGGTGTGGAGTGGTAGTGTGGTGGAAAMPPGMRNRARVFYSGHSLLDSPIPEHVQELAASLGSDLNFNLQNIVGSPIRVRTRGENGSASGFPGYSQGKNRTGMNMNVVQELRAPRTIGAGERYDTLVITERHDILSVIEWENTVGYLRHYHDRLIEGNPQGSTLFYHTWLDIDKNAPAAWIAHEKAALGAWECVSSKINLTLEAAGRPDRVRTLPGGAALVDLVEKIVAGQVRGLPGANTAARLNAIFDDDVHLTPTGSYYMAAVLYSAIFLKSPVGGRVPSGVPAEAAADFQRIAWTYVSNYYARPRPGERTMDECRTHIVQNVCASFWRLKAEPGKVSECTQTFGDARAENNPFKWPDPGFRPLPPP
jgi:hypothetical protein